MGWRWLLPALQLRRQDEDRTSCRACVIGRRCCVDDDVYSSDDNSDDDSSDDSADSDGADALW